MGLSFVPVTIASLTGVERADAGVASGLDQHEPPDRRRDRHRRGERDRRHVDEQLRANGLPSPRRRAAIALDHGFQTALYALVALLIVGALLTAVVVRPARVPAAEVERVDGDMVAIEEAA